MIATIIVTEDRCHKLPRKCSVWRNHNRSFPTFMTYRRFLTGVTRRMPHVEQELVTLTDQLRSLPILVGFVLLGL
jgi:hypothetical protein